MNSIASPRTQTTALHRECHHDTLPVYVPVTDQGNAPSLWTDQRRYTDTAAYRDALEAWFAVNIADHVTSELSDLGWCQHDAEILLDHLGRDGLHCAKDRSSIPKAWSVARDDQDRRKPLVWPQERVHLAEYIHFTNPSYAAVIVIDVDHVGEPGGRLSDLSLYVSEQVEKLTKLNLGPNWIGINPESGKSQMLWYIDPVYKAGGRESRPWKLLEALHAELQGYFEADRNFSHGWSRNPLYTGDNLGAYRWYAQHHEMFHMRLLSAGLWMLQGETVATMEDKGVEDRKRTQRFSSGRELINAARANTERARQAHEVLSGLEDEDLSEAFFKSDPDVIDGVRVVWQSPGRAQRDVTAFQHALRTAGKLYRKGEKMTDDRIIDAYRQAYEVAQSVGADGRSREEPPMRDLRSLARRVRGYVSGSKSISQATAKEAPGSASSMNSSERKALATLGRRGGKKAAERWKSDPDGAYAHAQRDKLAKANEQKKLQGNSTRAQVLAIAAEALARTGDVPTGAAIGRELGVTRKTASAHLRSLKEAGLLPFK